MTHPIDYERLAAQVVRAPGLDGSIDADKFSATALTPEVKAQYEAMIQKRMRK